MGEKLSTVLAPSARRITVTIVDVKQVSCQMLATTQTDVWWSIVWRMVGSQATSCKDNHQSKVSIRKAARASTAT